MFSGMLQAAHVGAPVNTNPPGEPGEKREIPPPTPVKFPSLLPRPPGTIPKSAEDVPLRTFLRGIQRPTDITLSHIEALGIHVIPDASLTDLIPDPSFLPPASWAEPLPDGLDDSAADPPQPLNNGRDAPGRKIYAERVKELSTANSAAFRTVRRLPPAPGDAAARLGNAYEFFKNLELLSGFWVDTSLPAGPEPAIGDDDPAPVHQRVNIRSGTGSQTPPEYRAALLAALVKLVAYDFTCNVSMPRVEPRLFIGPSSPCAADPAAADPAARAFPQSSPASSFPTNISFIYRTPSDRAAARSGIIEGPLAALSARHATGFDKPFDELLDLAREAVALLVTAQQRNRDGRDEPKLDPADPAKWWCHKPRWGGGPGGPIGKEEAVQQQQQPADEPENPADAAAAAAPQAHCPAATATATAVDGVPAPRDPDHLAASIGLASRGLPRSSSSSVAALGAALKGRSGRGGGGREGGRKTLGLYDNYRAVRAPASSWDRKARYVAIGRVAGAAWDDVFLVSCVNHHVAISRCRVGRGLLAELEGGEGGEEGGMTVWRSRWWDLFLREERIEAMTAVWGMMGWLMRRVEEGAEGMVGVQGGGGP